MTRSTRSSLLGAAAAVLFAAPPAHAQRPALADSFDEVQRNVMYVPTTDRAANLYVTTLGHGPDVIVLHGGPGNDFNYLVPAVRPLRDRYRFVLFDQRGSLLSPVSPDSMQQVTYAKIVEDIEALRVLLGQERVVLLAHSFGTILAQAYLRAHPERVAGLVLVASGPPVADSTRPLGAYVGELHGRMKRLRERAEVARALRDAGVDTAAAPGALSLAQRAARRRIGLASVNLANMARWREMIGGGVYYSSAVDDAVGNSMETTWDSRPAIARAGAPVTVINGDADYIDPSASEWKGVLVESDLVRISVLGGAGHYSWIDAPAEFERALRGALGRIPQLARD